MWLLALLLVTDSALGVRVPVHPAETLQVTIAGRGAPVVLIPGLFGSAFAFRKVIPLLVEGGHRVVVVEPLGVGASGRPERADYSLTAQADRIAAVLDTLAIRSAVVAAHSVGAAMAFRLAVRRPDLVGALVSLEGGPAESAATPGLRRAAQAAPWVKTLGGAKLVRKKLREGLIASSGDTSWVSEEVLDEYSSGARRELDATLKAYLRMADAREPERLAPRLSEIRCPVALLVGGAAHREQPSAKEIELLRGRLPSLVVDTVPGAGHHLQEERPEAVADAVRSVRAPSPRPAETRGSPAR